MRRLLVIVIFYMLVTDFAFSEVTIPSQIKEVTLFSNQALVKRKAKTKVKKGLNELFVELEAFNLDRNSVSAKVFGKGELYSVQLKDIYLKEAPQEKIRKLELEIRNLKDQRQVLLDELEILRKKNKFLDSLIDFSQTQIPADLKTSFPKSENLEEMIGFLEKNLKGIAERRQELNKTTRQINKKIEVLEKELATLKKPHQKAKKVIEILFNSSKDQEITIETDYLVYNCFWQPFYKADIPLSLKEINLVMFSKIRQKTGEDWSDIKLAVSNVIPLKGVTLPSLSSWFLDIKPRRARGPKAGFLLRAAQKAEVEALKELKFAEKAPPANFVSAQKKKLPLSFEYVLPQSLTIESKDKETLLPLFSKTLKGEFFHYVIPKVSPLTFFVCKVTSDKELLRGPLNVYFGGRFIGETFLTEKKPGEDFYLNLGADREIKVKKEKLKDKIKETFFGKIERKTIVREMAFKITIENLKEKPIKIKVLDSIPVSRTDRIEVKNVNLTPAPDETNYQDKEGVNLWMFELKPKGQKDIDIEFVITYPKDIPIIGL